MKPSPWVLAARPKTLSAAVAPVIVGTALALRDRGAIPWIYAGLALAGAVLIQIATNYINDALDFRRGADTSARLGPMRVTQAGLLTDRSVLRGAYVCLLLAALCGVPLILRGGLPILLIGVASIAAAYAYTGGPYPLAYHGLGELFVMIFFGIVAVGGTYYVLTLDYGADALWCGVAIGSLAVVILAINNLRDLPTDGASGKRTMAVRLGERGARLEIVVFAVIPYVIIGTLAAVRPDPSLWLVFLSLPLALTLVWRVHRCRGASLNRCLAMAGALQWAFAIFFAAGAAM
ncbi:MAG TPA: 1,4-dihydroxy-2-naphthoate polyprenyltransferase [Thermoanaerobaculia bacterium]|nr:1,4-dihydroxy-2-naphthoate polyprenyltransferase [Thermoanaerobaculia bacterium]